MQVIRVWWTQERDFERRYQIAIDCGFAKGGLFVKLRRDGSRPEFESGKRPCPATPILIQAQQQAGKYRAKTSNTHAQLRWTLIEISGGNTHLFCL